MQRKFTAVIQKHGHWYVGYIRQIPGVNTQGRTVPSTLRNLADAFRGIMEVRRQLGQPKDQTAMRVTTH